MDKKLIFSGGEPDITIRNTQYNSIADRAALFGVVKGLAGANNVIVSGAVVTLDPLVDASVTAGYVWLDGEILQVDAATVSETEGSDLWEFQKVVTYDAAGDKTFNDAIPRQTYQKNRAVLVNVSSVTGMDAVEVEKIGSGVWEPLVSEDTSGLSVDTSKAYIGLGAKGQVVFKGEIVVTGTPGSGPLSLFTVPSKYRASRDIGMSFERDPGGTFEYFSAYVPKLTGKLVSPEAIGTFYIDGATFSK